MEHKYQVTTKEHVIRYDGKEIYGKLYYPASATAATTAAKGAVIFSHGYNGCNEDFVRECTALAASGYVTYAYDFCGGSVRSRSSLKTTEMTIFTERADLLAVYEDISSLPTVPKDRIYLMGGSQGGLVTTLATEILQDKVAGMMLYFPALNIPEDWRRNYKTREEIPEVNEFWGMKLSRNFFLSIRDFHTFDNIGSYKGNVLIIYGAEDPIVPSGAIQKALEIYENIEYLELPGEAHGFTPEGTEKAIARMLEFLKKHEV